jgi:hypothetical protein
MIIRKGKHRSLTIPGLVLSRSITRTVTFTPSCRYDIGEDQSDWNKLFGVGFFPHHHRNSYRFAWRYDPEYDVIQIGAYWYFKGERRASVIDVVGINKPVNLKLYYDGDYIAFEIEGKVACKINSYWPVIGYKLGPYFGGNKTAPHDMKIEINA